MNLPSQHQNISVFLSQYPQRNSLIIPCTATRTSLTSFFLMLKVTESTSVMLTRKQHDSPFSAYGSSDWFGTVNHSVGISLCQTAHEMNSQSLARSKSLLIAMEKFLYERYFKYLRFFYVLKLTGNVFLKWSRRF